MLCNLVGWGLELSKIKSNTQGRARIAAKNPLRRRCGVRARAALTRSRPLLPQVVRGLFCEDELRKYETRFNEVRLRAADLHVSHCAHRNDGCPCTCTRVSAAL